MTERISSLVKNLVLPPLEILIPLLIAFLVFLFALFIYFRYRVLKSRAELYYEVLEKSGEAVCITNADAKIEYANQAYCDITGYTREELIGRNPKMMKSGRHAAAFYREMWDSLSETGQWQGEIWDRRRNGEVYPKWLTINALKGFPMSTRKFIGSFSDITTIKQTEEYIEKLVHYDSLTNLPNRLLLRERLAQAILASNSSMESVALLAVDINQFKKINNAFGYDAGDELLNLVGRRLQAAAGEHTTVGRIGPDKFAIILPCVLNREDVVHSARTLLDAFVSPVVVKGHNDVFVTISIGISIYPEDGDRGEILLKHAEIGMNLAKEEGTNRFIFFGSEMGDRSFENLSIETNLRYALERNEFILYYQPLVDTMSRRIIGVEALIRRKETDWITPPSKFIVIAEKAGLIVPICEWTLRTACMQAAQWQRDALPPLRVSVNMTATQFHQLNLANMVKKVLKETGLDAAYLELELTERIIMHDTQASISMMRDLKDLGVHLSIDDFGTGYSSLSYLKRLPLDKLKIDISFVRELPTDPDSVAIAKAIIDLAHNLNLRVIAEGVEKESQYLFLKEHGCDEIQGFYFSVPLPADRLKKLLLEESRSKHI
jgi:diguanylate cyclase (GGDEF)-like protein/PAS domain S-box-containing protein